MILGIDIGNTTISLAQLRPKSIRRLGEVDVQLPALKIEKKLKRYLKGSTKVYICSVVPKKTKVMERILKKHSAARVFVIGRTLKVDMVNRYQKKRQVGQDRLVGAYAARALYGKPVIIIDFGTAITFDVVSIKGHYEGGIILPGLKLSAESLFSKTALLPRIDRIQAPKKLVGKNTEQSILSGLFFGYGAMCRGLIKDIKAQYKGSPKVVLTGGYTHVMQKYIGSHRYHIQKNLVFEGLRIMANGK